MAVRLWYAEKLSLSQITEKSAPGTQTQFLGDGERAGRGGGGLRLHGRRQRVAGETSLCISEPD